MKKQYAMMLLLVGLILVSPAKAQERFTLDKCISYALENSINAKNAELDQQIAKAKVKETVGLGLPQISGSASVLQNQKLNRFFGRYSTSTSGFSFFPQGIAGAEDGDILAAQNFFQLKSSGTAGVSISQLLFNGSYLVGLQASNTYKELANKQADQTDEQIVLNVTKAYYGVLINKERIGLFDANIARVDSLLKTTKALNKNGFAEAIDVDRIQVALNNLTVEREKFVNLNELVMALLKFQMNYPMDQPLEIEGNIADFQVPADGLAEPVDYKKRPDYNVMEVSYKLQSLNVKNRVAEGMPTLAAFANLGYSTQSPTVGGLFKTNSNVKDNGTIGPDKWYGYSNFGISLSVPIFSGLSRTYRVQQEKLNLNKIENGFTAMKRGIDLEIKQANVTMQNGIKSLNAQKANMDLANNVARVTKIKYEQGVGSNLEVVEAENALKEAQINYYSSLYDVMIAKVDLDKAYGRILNQNTSK